MKLESIKVNIPNNLLGNIFILKGLKKDVEKKYKLFSKIKENIGNSTIEKLEQILDCCRSDIKALEKLERKANNYKKIIIEKDGDYDRSIIRIIFPKGTKMKFKKAWLKNNDYPTKTYHMNSSSLYDCTGEIHTVTVNYKANIVEIESLYDV